MSGRNGIIERQPLRPGVDTTGDEVVLVDDADVAIGVMDKLRAHEEGALHRAISVLLHDRGSRLLLHRRADGKYHSGGLWTNTCCSHPRPGEAVHEAAIRRLQEEMGITCALTPLFRMSYRVKVSERLTEAEIVHVFSGCFEGDPVPDPGEVGDWRWMHLSEVAQDVDRRPECYTAWFRKFRALHWDAITESATAALA
jgi:isopentenyl-diphosphate delta-isomerase